MTDPHQELLAAMESRFATREELDDRLARFVTREELDDRLAQFATREEMNARFDEVPTRAEMNARFDEVPTRAEMNARFDEVPTRAEMNARFDEMKRHTELLFENRWDDVRFLAEGLVGLSERLDRTENDLRRTMTEGFDRLESLIRVGYTDLDRRVTRLEERLGEA